MELLAPIISGYQWANVTACWRMGGAFGVHGGRAEHGFSAAWRRWLTKLEVSVEDFGGGSRGCPPPSPRGLRRRGDIITGRQAPFSPNSQGKFAGVCAVHCAMKFDLTH